MMFIKLTEIASKKILFVNSTRVEVMHQEIDGSILIFKGETGKGFVVTEPPEEIMKLIEEASRPAFSIVKESTITGSEIGLQVVNQCCHK